MRQDGAAKIKTKVGSDTPKVSRMEIHENRLEIIVQDPNNRRTLISTLMKRAP